MSVKLRPLDNDPLLDEVDNEPKLELLDTEEVDAERDFNWDSSDVIVLKASHNSCSNICFSSCKRTLKNFHSNVIHNDKIK